MFHNLRRGNQKKNLCSYEQLEPRQLLATTLYVDFGFGAENLTITDAQSSQLNGPEIFGSDYSIDSFTQGVIDDGLDTNNDDVVDEVDANNLAQGILANLSRILMPFDIAVSSPRATNVADIGASLGSSASQDAYIFVGGAQPVELVDNGEAIIDVGNLQDNLGFVFSHDFFTELPFGPEIAEVAYARAIAKQAAHTYGLRSVEGGTIDDFSLNQGSLDDVMAQRGTQDDGSFYGNRISINKQSFFTNREMPLTFENGVSSGTQNSFELMANTVGLELGGPAYLTGDSDVNEFEITAVSTNVVNVEIDGQLFDNIDVANGLWIETGQGRSGETVVVDSAVTANITINSPGILQMVGGPVSASIFGEDGEGIVNGNIFFDSLSTLITSEDDDEVTVHQAGGISTVDTRGGNDQVELLLDSRVINLLLGDGDDHFYNSGGLVAADFGGSNLDGGAGFDTWDFSFNELNGFNFSFNEVSEDGYSMTWYCHPRDDLCGTSYRLGMERVIGSQTQTNEARAQFRDPSNKLTWMVDGDTASVTDTTFDQSLELVGFHEFVGQATNEFDRFDGHYNPPKPLIDDFYVLATTLETTIYEAALLQISSNLDPALGTTDTIQADVKVGSIHPGSRFGEITSQIHVSNRQGTEPMSAHLGDAGTWGVFSGVADANVELITNMRYLITVDGTEKHNDVFEINYNFSNVFLNGHGGDDLFFMGSNAGIADGELDFLRQAVRVDGGDGLDRVHLNNQGALTGIDLRMSEKWLTPLNPDETEFVGVGITNLEVVQYQGPGESEHVRVFPSAQTRFILDANGPEGAGGDYLETKLPFGAKAEHLRTPSGNVWKVAGRELIVHQDFEKLNNINFVAVSSLTGQTTTVSTYEEPLGDFRGTIVPFGDNYTGGANTTFADVNYDGIPELIVAPKANSEPIVKIFEVGTGRLITSFTPYGSTYRDGIYVSVGNVTGDEGLEIVTSKMNGVPIVRVFSQNLGETNFRLKSQHRPFNNSFTSGATIAVADMNWDGYGDVISGAGRGELPQIAIHNVTNNDIQSSSVSQLNRFLVVNSAFRGGLNVAAGHWFGNAKPELFIGVGLNTVATSAFSGRVYAYQGERLSRNAPLTVLPPSQQVLAFEGTNQGVSLTTYDFDQDGKLDRVVTSNRQNGTLVKFFKPTDRFQLLAKKQF